MKQAKRKGYALILVMLVMLLIGAELFVLSGISQSMIFQTKTAYLEAQRRNIAASAAAWKKHQAWAQEKTSIPTETVGNNAK